MCGYKTHRRRCLGDERLLFQHTTRSSGVVRQAISDLVTGALNAAQFYDRLRTDGGFATLRPTIVAFITRALPALRAQYPTHGELAKLHYYLFTVNDEQAAVATPLQVQRIVNDVTTIIKEETQNDVKIPGAGKRSR